MSSSGFGSRFHISIQFLQRLQRQSRRRRPAVGRLCACLLAIWCFSLSAVVAEAIPTASAGYSLSTVDPGGSAYGDVVTVGDFVFVGVGSFGSNEIVRIAPGGATTTIATGFSSLTGFAYDAVNDRLIMGDNFYNGTTGDTVYALSNPVGFAGPPAAASSLKLLPDLSIPGVADVAMDLSDPTGMTIFITDTTEAFPPLDGALLKLAVGTSTLSTVFDVGAGWFAGGVASSTADLFVGDSIFGTGGRIRQSDLPLVGSPPATNFLIDGPDYLPGQYDLELDGDGMLLSTSLDVLVRVDPSDGTRANLASGFDFATGLASADDGSIFVIDGTELFKLTPVPEPGTAPLVALGLVGVTVAARRSRAARLSPPLSPRFGAR